MLETEPGRFYHSTVKLKVKTPEESLGVFPDLIIKKDNQWLGVIDLNEEVKDKEKADVDWLRKIIVIKHPIKIFESKKKGDYGSDAGMERGS